MAYRRQKLKVDHVDSSHGVTSARVLGSPTCPYCGAMADGATAPNEAGRPRLPAEGDIGICCECIEISIFQADGQKRKPTAAELIEIAGDPNVTLLVNWARRDSSRKS